MKYDVFQPGDRVRWVHVIHGDRYGTILRMEGKDHAVVKLDGGLPDRARWPVKISIKMLRRIEETKP